MGILPKSKADLNREFYDTVATIYEKADRRRDRPCTNWILEKIDNVVSMIEINFHRPAGNILDIGAGTGYISRLAALRFDHVYAMDISRNMLDCITNPRIIKLVGDATQGIPLPDSSVDAVVTFAVLHHIEDHRSVFKEIARVLRPGGVYWSDHDINADWVRRHRFAVWLYRKIFDPARQFSHFCSDVTRELYNAVEVHSQGIEPDQVRYELEHLPFDEVDIGFHWRGLLPDRYSLAFGLTPVPENAPLMSIVAVK